MNIYTNIIRLHNIISFHPQVPQWWVRDWRGFLCRLRRWKCWSVVISIDRCFKNAYQLLNLRAFKISTVYNTSLNIWVRYFAWMSKLLRAISLKCQMKYLINTLKDAHFVYMWRFNPLIWFNTLKLSDAYIGHQNGPSLVQGIFQTSAGCLSNGPLGTHSSEIRTNIQQFLLKKLNVKMSYANVQSFGLGISVLSPRDCFWSGHGSWRSSH